MDSLFGGKQGLSIIIKDTFESIADAVAACKRGPEYTRTWYNELLIISTPNLNDEDNGKVFRRGLEYNNDMGGLELIAQIVGPCGGTPLFQMNTIKEVKDKSTMAIGKDDYRRYPIGYEMDDEGHVTGYKINTDANEPIATFPFSKAHDTSLVPGKTDDGGFNDEILWTWCNIRKPNQESDSWFYVGFTITYLVTEYQTHTMSQYDGSGNIVSNPTEIDRVDDKSHPFYQKWDIGLPKGIKGDTLRNLRIITPTSADKSRIYSPSAITVSGTTGVVSVGEAGYSGIDDDIANERQILVYDFYYYVEHNPDVAAAFGNDDIAVLEHFVNCGMREGRQGSASFNVNVYRDRYGDLQQAFGDDLRSYYIHYLDNGLGEGRTGI